MHVTYDVTLSEVIRDCSDTQSGDVILDFDSLNDVISLDCYEHWNVIFKHHADADGFGQNWTTMRDGFDRNVPYGGHNNQRQSNEYWIGNEALHQLTSRYDSYILRIDMWTDEQTYEYAEFDGFRVASENDAYALTLTDYHAGSAGPGGMVTYHSGKPFATADRDNDRNCSYNEGVAWWFMNDDVRVIDISHMTPEGTSTSYIGLVLPTKHKDELRWYETVLDHLSSSI